MPRACATRIDAAARRDSTRRRRPVAPAIAARPDAADGAPVSGPLILRDRDRRATRPGIALIEGGRRIHANVVASPGRAPRRRPAGSCPEVAARAHLRWIVPVLDEAWADAGATWTDVDAVAVTYGPGLAGSLLVGINFAKALAWVHDKPLVGVNHLEGHVYAAWLRRPGRRRTRPEPVFPLVALVVSGGHTFLAEMRDHLTYRLLGHDRRRRGRRGVRQGRPAARARLPGRPGDRSGGRGARRATTASSRGRGSAIRTTSASRASRPRPAGSSTTARADEAACADEPDGAAPRRGRRRARRGVPGRRRRRPRHQDDPGRRGGRRARRSCSAAASPRTRALRARLAGEAEAAGRPADRAAAGPVHRQRGDDRRRRRRDGSRPASGPASTSTPGRRCRWRPGERRRPRPRVDPAAVRATLRAAGLRARHALSQNFLADPDVLDAILAEADPAPGGGVLEIGPGLGLADRRRCSTPARRSPRSSSTAGSRRSCASGSTSRLEAGGSRLDRGRRARPGPRPTSSSRRRTTSSRTCRTTSPARSSIALLGAPPRPERLGADGPARGRRADRGAAREDELPVGASCSTTRGSGSRSRVPPPAVRAEPGGRVGGHRRRAVSTPTTGSTRETEDELWRLVQAGFRERRKMIHNVLVRQLPVDAAAWRRRSRASTRTAPADAGGGRVARAPGGAGAAAVTVNSDPAAWPTRSFAALLRS